MERKFKIAVVGATGAVGKELLSIIESRRFPVGDLLPFASPRSEGKGVDLGGRSLSCQTLKPGCFKGVDIAFFDASDAVSAEWVPEAVASGAWVVDNSGTFRMHEKIPLLVPEINGHLLRDHLRKGERIIAGPNCSTVQLAMALKPIRDRWGLKRVVVSTYQSTSGAGAAAMEELSVQSQDSLNGGPASPRVFPHPIAFNCLPQIGGFKQDGYTSEETKIIAEARKILEMPDLKVTATAVRVPTFSCHAESINVECDIRFEVSEVREALNAQAGVTVLDKPENQLYPLGLAAKGKDSVYVGRIRRDLSLENGLNLWVVSDNLRKGAALNAVQIGENLLEYL